SCWLEDWGSSVYLVSCICLASGRTILGHHGRPVRGAADAPGNDSRCGRASGQVQASEKPSDQTFDWRFAGSSEERIAGSVSTGVSNGFSQKPGSERYVYNITDSGTRQVLLHAGRSGGTEGPDRNNRNSQVIFPNGFGGTNQATGSRPVTPAVLERKASIRSAQGALDPQSFALSDPCLKSSAQSSPRDVETQQPSVTVAGSTRRVTMPRAAVTGGVEQLTQAWTSPLPCLDRDGLVKHFRRIAHDAEALTSYAQSIGQRQLQLKNAAAQDLLRMVVPRARQIWGPHVQLTLHGSRAKNTFIDDSDFDYHIEGTDNPITLDDMYKFGSLCREVPNVVVVSKITIALVLHFNVPQLEDRTLQVEFVPERADYIHDSSEHEPFIEAASTYFVEHPCACYVVRLLKSLFQRTQPKLKGCALEQMVEQMHSNVSRRHPCAWRDAGLPRCTRDLFSLCLKQIEDQPECHAMAALASEVFTHGLPQVSIHAEIAFSEVQRNHEIVLSEVRRNPELHFREVSPFRWHTMGDWYTLLLQFARADKKAWEAPMRCHRTPLRCSPERALRALSPLGRPQLGTCGARSVARRPQLGSRGARPVLGASYAAA
ncbi:unnamed protein product, partial [Prorocentrum cordatum]